ncbi:glutamate receptor ionotropic, delta-1-like [Panulirus ornatus]|uniref:glutamate receptor ionotropic, delta-1-like n=1 Tax=Panulirus ornatus TaxID=150431 RepID=UPI003A87FF9D
MYCDDGEADLQFIHFGSNASFIQRTTDLFNEQTGNLMGHTLRVVTVTYFPYMDFNRDNEEPGTSVTPKDSVDTRLLTTFTRTLNFTYEIYEDPEKAFGREKEGKFDGMIGQLQREEADFCTISAPSTKRMKVVQYLWAYPADLMTVISLKPSLLPKHLSLIRPFERELWFAVVVSVVAWGVILWLLQRAWRWVSRGRGVRLSTAFMYGWGALLEQPHYDPSISTSGRMLVGWWLVFSLIITTAYRSSMVAHMTVQGMSQPLETFNDLVKQDGWSWGTEPWLLSGVLSDYFSKHNHPVIQEIYKKMEVLVAEEALKKVLKGGYSLIDFENYIAIIIAAHYTDVYGNTPFFVSKKGFAVISSYGWSFRKGAPFYLRFSQLMHRLEDAGIVNHWIQDTLDRRVRQIRKATDLKPQANQRIVSQEDNIRVVLGLQHLQGAFYLLLLGSGVSIIVLIGENLAPQHSKLS